MQIDCLSRPSDLFCRFEWFDMAYISPREIELKAAKAYPKYLRQWFDGTHEAFFPYAIRGFFDGNADDLKRFIASDQALGAMEKLNRGWGYTVHRERKTKRILGSNDFICGVTIDTEFDLLSLAGKSEEFAESVKMINTIRCHFPGLESWIKSNLQTLYRYADIVGGLIAVTQFFIANPSPNCFARQIPVPVDTKFIERNRTVLHQWLDLLLSPDGIDANESDFYRRFGLRDKDNHVALRFLDASVQAEIGVPFDELSLPLSVISKLSPNGVNVVIVENDLNLLTLPLVKRGLAIRGQGMAVTRLQKLRWLANNCVYYWGDMDIDGYHILARLRHLIPNVQSVLMDWTSLQSNLAEAGPGRDPEFEQIKKEDPNTFIESLLTAPEFRAFHYCLETNTRIEQEKIPPSKVNVAFANLLKA